MATLGSPTGGALTAANAATGDKFPVVDVSVGASDSANKTMTASELRLLQNKFFPDGTFAPPPAASALTWFNQGTATVTDVTNGGFLLTTDAVGNDATKPRAVGLAVPGSTPWAITARMFAYKYYYDYNQHGVFVTDGTKYQYICAYFNHASSFQTLINGTQAPTFGGTTAAISGCTDVESSIVPEFMRIRNDGTNLYYEYSYDGIYWVQIGQQAKATYLGTITYAGIIGLSFNPSGTTRAVKIHCTNWLLA